MYAVIFKATINKLDDTYSKTAARMRELAMNEYGCSEFVSVTEGDHEISISYWKEQKDIIEWKKNSEHLATQELGKSKWYKYYQVQVVEIIREYKYYISSSGL
jgi:heme-degrading monooxygenase HmoA